MSYSANELRAFDEAALENNQFISSVSGKSVKNKASKKIKSWSAVGFIAAILVVFGVFFSSGNIIPSAISDRLIEETDVQYADAVMSKEVVFQQAMRDGNIPKDTEELLEKEGIKVGKNNGETVLSFNDKTVTADDFFNEVNNDAKLYNAFTRATYGRAAYYYDDAAKKVFNSIGTNRDSFSDENMSFEEVMSAKLGQGSDINVNNVSLARKNAKNENGEEVETYEYEQIGGEVNSNTSASEFIEAVREMNTSASATTSALNSADTLKVADTISKEQRSSLFYVTFMETISKMKAEKGNESRIHEAMDYLHKSVETEVVDIKTGELVKVSGTALESPSLYSLLAGQKVDPSRVENYSSDRILKTIEYKLGSEDGKKSIPGTIASSSKTKGSIGRLIDSGVQKASSALLSIVEPTISNSLIDNSFDSIEGVAAGEFLVEGAVNVGKELAKQSGASAGDATAVTQYARLNSSVLAMDAAVDRMNRSPFDISSKNTFLGSLVYKFAITFKQLNTTSVFSSFSVILNSTKSSLVSLLPSVYADETSGYLSSFGDCDTYSLINAVGSPQCSEIATFDTSTLENPFSDPGFVSFVNNNTTINSSGTRTINNNSALANYIIYNNERKTPLGVTDGGILESLKSNSSSIDLVSNILAMIRTWFGTNESEKRIASGEAFVNSSANPDWQTYKYAQRYVSLARATSSLRQYSNDKTAYRNIQFFEGEENPVMAFLQSYYALNNN